MVTVKVNPAASHHRRYGSECARLGFLRQLVPHALWKPQIISTQRRRFLLPLDETLNTWASILCMNVTFLNLYLEIIPEATFPHSIILFYFILFLLTCTPVWFYPTPRLILSFSAFVFPTFTLIVLKNCLYFVIHTSHSRPPTLTPGILTL